MLPRLNSSTFSKLQNIKQKTIVEMFGLGHTINEGEHTCDSYIVYTWLVKCSNKIKYCIYGLTCRVVVLDPRALYSLAWDQHGLVPVV